MHKKGKIIYISLYCSILTNIVYHPGFFHHVSYMAFCSLNLLPLSFWRSHQIHLIITFSEFSFSFIVSLCFCFVPYFFSLREQLHQHPSVLVIHFYIQSIFIQHIVILDPLFSCPSHASEVTHFHCTQYIFIFFPAYSPLIFI